MCQKQLHKKPSELHKNGGCPLELQLPDTEWPTQHCITEFIKISNGADCSRSNVFTSRYTSQQIFSENEKLMWWNM